MYMKCTLTAFKVSFHQWLFPCIFCVWVLTKLRNISRRPCTSYLWLSFVKSISLLSSTPCEISQCSKMMKRVESKQDIGTIHTTHILLCLFWIPNYLLHMYFTLVLCKNSTYHNIICHTYKNISYVSSSSSSSIIRFQLPKVSGLQWYQAPLLLTIRLSTVVDCEYMMCHTISCLARIPNSFYCDICIVSTIDLNHLMLPLSIQSYQY